MPFKVNVFFLVLISAIIPFNYSYEAFKLNEMLFFDPVEDTICNQLTYWTPFDQNSTCYRFVNLEPLDHDKRSTLKIMLDHNIGMSTYSDYPTVLKQKTETWTRYNGTIDIIDEGTIYKIMKYGSKPTSNSSVSPPYRIGHYFMNSKYIVNGEITNQNGYWTKSESGSLEAFVIDSNGNNKIVPKTSKYGIRPVLTIDKSLLRRDGQVISMNDFFTNSSMFQYKSESVTYDGFLYQKLQGFTVTKDKLVFISSNDTNKEKSVIYSYLTEDLNSLYNAQYTNIGSGNGITYNTKKKKILIAGPDEYENVFELNSISLRKEKEYPTTSYPKFNGIGYDYNDDLYVGYNDKTLFFANTTDMKKIYEWDMPMFEIAQDLEYYNGYLFVVTTDFGDLNKDQSYSFFGARSNIIYVYGAKLDKNKKPTFGFGKLICRLYIQYPYELQDLAFRNGNIYFGFSMKRYGAYYYTFYQYRYIYFATYIKIIAKKQGAAYFD